jgi:hypothetical protein
VLQIAVSAAPSAAGGNGVLDIPATIVVATEIEDTAGTQFQPAGDPDVVIDVEGGAEPA